MATMAARWIAISFLVVTSLIVLPASSSSVELALLDPPEAMSLPVSAGVPLPKGATANAAPEAQDPPHFFSVGLYCVDWAPPYDRDVTQEFPDIATAGFNTVHLYESEGDAITIERLRDYLDAAGRNGLKVLMGIPRPCVLHRNLACIRERVAALQDHEDLFGWELFDEPDTSYDSYDQPEISPETLALAYNEVKRLDPNHPVAIASYRLVDPDYRHDSGFDIIMSGYLPLLHVERPTVPVMPYLDSAVRILTPRGKSVFAQVLVYNPANDSVIWPREWDHSLGGYPTRGEMRFMSFYAIVRGATGIIFNCYRFGAAPPDGDDVSRMHNPLQWAAILSVSSELRSMVPIFLAPTQDRQSAGVTIMGATPIDMLIKQYQGKTYLFTVNPSLYALELPIHLTPDWFPNPTVTLLPERRSIPFRNGSFTARWDSEDVLVYEISPGVLEESTVSPDADGGRKSNAR